VIAGGPEGVRQAARAILDEHRFHGAAVPRPLHGVLQAIGQALDSPLRLLEDLFGELASVIPGGAVGTGILLGSIALALAIVATRQRVGRRLQAAGHATGPGATAGAPSAAELERAAAVAERERRFDEAVRLRFRAGLLRLADRELVPFEPSMSNVAIARALRSQRFERLARSFDEIVYGGRSAGTEDVDAARSEWPMLLKEGRRA
jgi:Domain of unknown function (DUF4129)